MTVIIVLPLLFAVFLFFIAPRMLHKADRTPFLNRHYAHRGLFDNASEAPENSLAAMKKAVEAGYGIEFDVQLSKDHKLVVFHDASLQRMCGVDGKVWEYTLEELQQFKLADSEETIPTFEAVLEAVNGKVPLIIEYKLDRVQTEVCRLADKVLQNYKGVYCVESFHPTEVCRLADKVLQNYKGVYCVESFHPLAVCWYRKNRPDVMRGQLCEEYFRNPRNKGIWALYIMSFLISNVAARPDFIAYNHEHADNISRRLCRRMGALSVAYTVKNEEDYQRAKNKFDLFIFDSFILK